MSKELVISTIGTFMPGAPAGASNHELTQAAIAFWSGQIDQVLPYAPDLIVIPEMCDTYASLGPNGSIEYYRERRDKVRDALSEIARRHNCYVTYPAVRAGHDGKWRNSVQLLDRKGEVMGAYNKNHVVICETLDYDVLCGTSTPIFECDFGRVGFAICFDLNFDELRLKYAAAKPDLIVFPSMYHGGLMQSYWAYSCRSHFVGSISGTGSPSSIIAPTGELLASTTNYFNYVSAKVNLDCRLIHLDGHWEKLRALKAKYGTAVTIHDPGHLGSVLVTCNAPEHNIDEWMQEFGFELLDDYFQRSLAHHHAECNRGA